MKQKTHIPKTYSAAKAKGYKAAAASSTKKRDTSSHEIVSFNPSGLRVGSLSSIETDPNDKSLWLVCYLNANRQCHWVNIPKTQQVPDIDPSGG